MILDTIDFLNAVKAVNIAINHKIIRPTHRNVKIVPDIGNQRIFIFGTNFIQYAKFNCSADLEDSEAESFLVDALMLEKILKQIYKKKIYSLSLELNYSESGIALNAVIKIPSQKYKLNTFDIEEFVEFPILKETRARFLVNSFELEELLAKTTFCFAKNKPISRFDYQIGQIQMQKNYFAIASTDAGRLSVAKVAIWNREAKMDLENYGIKNINLFAMEKLLKTHKTQSWKITFDTKYILMADENKNEFSFEASTDHYFPNISSIISSTNNADCIFEFDTKETLASLEDLEITVNKESNRVEIKQSVTEKEITLNTENCDRASTEIKMSLKDFRGNFESISLNIEYMREFFKTCKKLKIESASIQIKHGAPIAFFVRNWIYIVMPMSR